MVLRCGTNPITIGNPIPKLSNNRNVVMGTSADGWVCTYALKGNQEESNNKGGIQNVGTCNSARDAVVAYTAYRAAICDDDDIASVIVVVAVVSLSSPLSSCPGAGAGNSATVATAGSPTTIF